MTNSMEKEDGQTLRKHMREIMIMAKEMDKGSAHIKMETSTWVNGTKMRNMVMDNGSSLTVQGE
jgi:hypothetical protein